MYEPAPRKRNEKSTHTERKGQVRGVLTVPEVFAYFGRLKQKHGDIYDWYVMAERLDAGRVGQELEGSGGHLFAEVQRIIYEANRASGFMQYGILG